MICTCPDYEDAYILQYAIENRAIVVSNDMYRDFPRRYPEALRPIMERFLKTHVMPYAFTQDQFCPSNEFIYPDFIVDSDDEDVQSVATLESDVQQTKDGFYESDEDSSHFRVSFDCVPQTNHRSNDRTFTLLSMVLIIPSTSSSSRVFITKYSPAASNPDKFSSAIPPVAVATFSCSTRLSRRKRLYFGSSYA